MINFYQLQTFVTVISEGSMTAAADKLFLTQPAVSQQIRGLEEGLGVELLVRGVRQVKPTLKGEILYENAIKILQMVHQTEVAITSMGAEMKGTLRVGSLNSIGLPMMSGVMSKVLRHNPSLHFKLDYGKADDLIEAYLADALDIVIAPDLQTEYGISPEGTECRLIQREEMWLVAPAKDWAAPKEIHIKELGVRPFISYSGEYPGFSKALQKALDENNATVNAVFESSNVGTLKRVLESGLGWGYLPAQSIKKQVKLGRMNRIHVNGFQYGVNINFYNRAKTDIRALVDIFYNSLQAQEKS